MKNKWRILKILITVILLVFLLSFSLDRFSRQNLDQISVRMTQGQEVYFVDEKDIKSIVKKLNPTRKIGDVNIPELEKKLNALPHVNKANVYMNLNGKLNIEIEQRVPVFRLNNKGNQFYVDQFGKAFPVSRVYSHPAMLVTGNVNPSEYTALVELIEKINTDDFSRKFFVGISKEKESYHLLTGEGVYKVEIGDLENIDFKLKGFKTFSEKYLVYQDPLKYKKISVKFDNQIVTTLNSGFKGADSLNTYVKTVDTPQPVKLQNTVTAQPLNGEQENIKDDKKEQL